MKTKEQIEEMAKEEAKKIRIHGSMITPYDVQSGYEKGFREAYTQAQQDLIEGASADFNEWWNCDKDIPEILMRASEKVKAVTNMAERCALLSEFWAQEAWQAARLSMMKELNAKESHIRLCHDKILKRSTLSNEEVTALFKEIKQLKEDLKWAMKEVDYHLEQTESENMGYDWFEADKKKAKEIRARHKLDEKETV